MRPPKFATEAEKSITSSIYLCDLLNLQQKQATYYIINIFMRPPKFAIDEENYITSSLCLYVLRPKFAKEV